MAADRIQFIEDLKESYKIYYDLHPNESVPELPLEFRAWAPGVCWCPMWWATQMPCCSSTPLGRCWPSIANCSSPLEACR